jgi:hypothetical protein
MRSRKYERARQLAAMDPVRDRVEIGRALLQYEFPWDFVRSLELALFRTYAVPSIGGLLDRTGEFTARTQKRYDDTQLIVYDMWLAGPSEPAGRIASEHLNRIHGHYKISNDDFRYVLATFVVIPIRWLRTVGWRALSAVEIDGWTNLMRDMGAAMRIDGVPETYGDFERLLDAYEAEHFAYDAGAARVAKATLGLMASWYPAPMRPAVRAATPWLIDEPVARSLDLPLASARQRRLGTAAVRARSQVVRVLPPRRRPFHPKPRTYPDGYELTHLGPDAIVRRLVET